VSARTTLVTIVGPAGRRDLSLPADAPIRELLPPLVDLAGKSGSGRTAPSLAWTLSPTAGVSMSLDTSLSEQRILDGTVFTSPRLAQTGPLPLRRPSRPLPTTSPHNRGRRRPFPAGSHSRTCPRRAEGDDLGTPGGTRRHRRAGSAAVRSRNGDLRHPSLVAELTVYRHPFSSELATHGGRAITSNGCAPGSASRGCGAA
jgi:hypothetical protein